MRIPVIKGVIKRRLLLNYRADPAAVQRLIPRPFRPKLHAGHSIVGICLIRLEQIRPRGVPGMFGISSENAAHRIAVEWTDGDGVNREGVYIPRRDTSSFLNHLVGGRAFPGEHHPAKFSVFDSGSHVEFSMRSLDSSVSVGFVGDDCSVLPTTSCFGSLLEASEFFRRGSLGYSATGEGDRLDGLSLRTLEWRVNAMSVVSIQSSYFSDEVCFPVGSIEFDHALVMRDMAHEWHAAEDLFTQSNESNQSTDPTPIPILTCVRHV